MDISDWRRKIDEVDSAVLKLLNIRADMALEIAKLKSVEGIGLRAPVREREIVERMQSLNPGPLDADAIEKIYATIVNQCIRAQERSQTGSLQRPAGDRARTPKKRDVTRTAGRRRKPRK